MITDPRRLLEELPNQRWFGFKGKALAGIELVDEVILDDGPPALVIAIVAVSFEGTVVRYQLPLLVEADGSSRDVASESQRLTLVGELMAQGDSVKGDSGVVTFSGPGLDPLAPPGSGSARVLSAEQSNTSVVLDDAVVIKFFRRLEIGPNPDLELNRLLTSEGFDHVPAQVGEITYEGRIDDEDVTIDLGIAQQFLGDGVEAWSHVIACLHGFFDEVDPADVEEDRRFLTEERSGPLLDEIAELGDVIAGMHVALSRDDSDPSLVPEPLEPSDVEDLVARIDASIPVEGPVAALAAKIHARVEGLAALEDLGAKTRIHGDLHLGQVMTTPRGWMLLDFEGEPLRSLEERRVKRSPLKDVAGMLRSFNYAAVATLFERCSPDEEEWARLEPWATEWEDLARERFLTGYLTRAHEGRFLPGDRDALALLLGALEIEKALYELAYERGHRPDWVRIPERGIERALEGSS